MGCVPTKQIAPSKLVKVERKTSMVMVDDLPKHYDFKEFLGRGKDGHVMLVESLETSQKAAIKVVAKENSSITNEIKNLSEVDHPNIIKFFKHYKINKNIYMVMEFCSKGDLFEKIVNQSKFTEDEVVDIMEKLLRAINHCHHLGIIHRDLKPENIMYSSNGTLKIIDFGLSMREEEIVKERVVGTSYYIAPEILVDQVFTKACDIWSLGIIMHALISSYVPIGGNNFDEICDRIRNYRGPSFNSAIWNSVSKEAKDLLKKMLDPDYELRITAEQALKHPWFASRKSNKVVCNEKVLEALKKYSEFTMTKKNLLESIARGIDDEELQDLFLELDNDKTGQISYSNLKEALELNYSELSTRELEQTIRNVNRNAEPFISYTSFVAAMLAAQNFITEEKLESLFKTTELEQGCFTQDTVSSLLPEDVEGIKSRLSFEEFKSILSK